MGQDNPAPLPAGRLEKVRTVRLRVDAVRTGETDTGHGGEHRHALEISVEAVLLDWAGNTIDSAADSTTTDMSLRGTINAFSRQWARAEASTLSTQRLVQLRHRLTAWLFPGRVAELIGPLRPALRPTFNTYEPSHQLAFLNFELEVASPLLDAVPWEQCLWPCYLDIPGTPFDVSNRDEPYQDDGRPVEAQGPVIVSGEQQLTLCEGVRFVRCPADAGVSELRHERSSSEFTVAVLDGPEVAGDSMRTDLAEWLDRIGVKPVNRIDRPRDLADLKAQLDEIAPDGSPIDLLVVNAHALRGASDDGIAESGTVDVLFGPHPSLTGEQLAEAIAPHARSVLVAACSSGLPNQVCDHLARLGVPAAGLALENTHAVAERISGAIVQAMRGGADLLSAVRKAREGIPAGEVMYGYAICVAWAPSSAVYRNEPRDGLATGRMSTLQGPEWAHRYVDADDALAQTLARIKNATDTVLSGPKQSGRSMLLTHLADCLDRRGEPALMALIQFDDLAVYDSITPSTIVIGLAQALAERLDSERRYALENEVRLRLDGRSPEAVIEEVLVQPFDDAARGLADDERWTILADLPDPDDLHTSNEPSPYDAVLEHIRRASGGRVVTVVTGAEDTKHWPTAIAVRAHRPGDGDNRLDPRVDEYLERALQGTAQHSEHLAGFVRVLGGGFDAARRVVLHAPTVQTTYAPGSPPEVLEELFQDTLNVAAGRPDFASLHYPILAVLTNLAVVHDERRVPRAALAAIAGLDRTQLDRSIATMGGLVQADETSCWLDSSFADWLNRAGTLPGRHLGSFGVDGGLLLADWHVGQAQRFAFKESTEDSDTWPSFRSGYRVADLMRARFDGHREHRYSMPRRVRDAPHDLSVFFDAVRRHSVLAVADDYDAASEMSIEASNVTEDEHIGSWWLAESVWFAELAASLRRCTRTLGPETRRGLIWLQQLMNDLRSTRLGIQRFGGPSTAETQLRLSVVGELISALAREIRADHHPWAELVDCSEPNDPASIGTFVLCDPSIATDAVAMDAYDRCRHFALLSTEMIRTWKDGQANAARLDQPVDQRTIGFWNTATDDSASASPVLAAVDNAGTHVEWRYLDGSVWPDGASGIALPDMLRAGAGDPDSPAEPTCIDPSQACVAGVRDGVLHVWEAGGEDNGWSRWWSTPLGSGDESIGQPKPTCAVLWAGGDFVALGFDDHHIRLYSREASRTTAGPAGVLDGHGQPIRVIAYDDHRIISLDVGGTVRTWDERYVMNGENPEDARNPTGSIRWSNNLTATVGHDPAPAGAGSIRTLPDWDEIPQDDRPRFDEEGSSDDQSSVAVLDVDGPTVRSAQLLRTSDNSLTVRDHHRAAAITCAEPITAAQAMTLPDGRIWVALECADGDVRIYRIRGIRSEPLPPPPLPDEPPETEAIAADGEAIDLREPPRRRPLFRRALLDRLRPGRAR